MLQNVDVDSLRLGTYKRTGLDRLLLHDPRWSVAVMIMPQRLGYPQVENNRAVIPP